MLVSWAIILSSPSSSTSEKAGTAAAAAAGAAAVVDIEIGDEHDDDGSSIERAITMKLIGVARGGGAS